ncbi:MAG TPA: helix-turn-helix transcriptional regulator [Vibrio sp.]|uniref:Helix-turn-helix transcriptional regulator n=2 Tax=Vibrionaceae TaxID=641 RepID=A0A368LPY6_9VIBR|nr:helix-turn-helix transcriptional regulator [Vibrio casei]HBV77179.1 helix-turn-helix transcriptional regulator [Vibrio sp.]
MNQGKNMINNHQGIIVYFLSPHVSDSTSLFSYLQDELSIEIQSIALETLGFVESQSQQYIVLVDTQFSESKLFELQTHPFLKQAIATALFNAPTHPNLTLLTQWYQLSGYFYQHECFSEISNGIKAILNGHNCLPKPLLVTLFQHWQVISRQNNNIVVKAKLSLTHRELEILNHLQVGQSNLDIADNLFVSEHTIKSHLYRIFKKINVDNRRQAINWAQLYL